METVHQETAGTALPRLREGLPPPLRTLLHHEVLGSQDAEASVELDAGLDLLLAIDHVLCGGSGVVTTRIATTLASRVLSQSAGLVVPGDAVATLKHLRAPFEQPFIDMPLAFSVRRNHEGFMLELHAPNEARAARWLGSAGLGYAKAATRFSGDGVARLRLYLEIVGDVARVLGRHTDSGVVNVPGSGAPREERPRPARRRSSPTNAAARVDEILSRATPSPSAAGIDMRAVFEARARGAVRVTTPAPSRHSAPAPSDSGARSASARPASELSARSRKSAL